MEGDFLLEFAHFGVQADVNQKLADVPDFAGKLLRFLGPFGVVSQQFGIVFQKRAAAGAGGNDHVHFERAGQLDVFSGQVPCRLHFAVAGGGQAAADKVGHGDFHLIFIEHANRCGRSFRREIGCVATDKIGRVVFGLVELFHHTLYSFEAFAGRHSG